MRHSMRNTEELVPLTYAGMNISKRNTPITTPWAGRISLGFSESPCPCLGCLVVEVVWCGPPQGLRGCDSSLNTSSLTVKPHGRKKIKFLPPLYSSAWETICFCNVPLFSFSYFSLVFIPSRLHVEGTRHYFEEMLIIHVPHTDRNTLSDQVKQGLFISVLACPIIPRYCTEHEIISKCETIIVTEIKFVNMNVFVLYKSEHLHWRFPFPKKWNQDTCLIASTC